MEGTGTASSGANVLSDGREKDAIWKKNGTTYELKN